MNPGEYLVTATCEFFFFKPLFFVIFFHFDPKCEKYSDKQVKKYQICLVKSEPEQHNSTKIQQKPPSRALDTIPLAVIRHEPQLCASD